MGTWNALKNEYLVSVELSNSPVTFFINDYETYISFEQPGTRMFSDVVEMGKKLDKLRRKFDTVSCISDKGLAILGSMIKDIKLSNITGVEEMSNGIRLYTKKGITHGFFQS